MTTFKIADYNGGFPGWPTRLARGYLRVFPRADRFELWEGNTHRITGQLSEWSFDIKPTGNSSCHVTISARANSNLKAQLDLPKTSNAKLHDVLGRREPNRGRQAHRKPDQRSHPRHHHRRTVNFPNAPGEPVSSTVAASRRVEVSKPDDTTVKSLISAFSRLNHIEQSGALTYLDGTLRFKLNRVRVRVVVSPGSRPGASIVEISADDRGRAGRVVVDRLIANLIPQNQHRYRQRVLAFLLIILILGPIAVLLLTPFPHSNPGDPNIGKLANAHVPVLTRLAQWMINTSPAHPGRTGVELGLLLAAIPAAVITVPVPLARWLWQKVRWLSRQLGRTPWLIPIGVAFGAGVAAGWLPVVLIAAVGSVIAVVVWLSPLGAGTAITRLWARRLPGIREGIAGRRPALLLGAALAVGPGLTGTIGATLGAYLADLPSDVHLSGYAVVASPLTAATVKVYGLSAKGKPGALLATATTDLHGHYTATVPRRPGEVLLVTTASGHYVDEITGRTVIAGPKDSLKSVVTSGSTTASPNPLSTFATVRSMEMASTGTPLDSSITAAFDDVARQFDLPDLEGLDPAIANMPPAEQPIDPSFDSRQLGLILAGLDGEANTLGATDFQLSDAITSDLSDGNLDGKDNAAAVALDTTSMLPDNATTTPLQKQIDIFAAAPDNLTDIPAPQISATPCTIYIDVNQPYITTPSAPNFIDGQAGAVPIVGINGKYPYHCRVADGQVLPEAFSLSDCTLVYTGRLIVGDMAAWTSPPFAIIITDSAHPPKSSTAAVMSVTVRHPPPKIHIAGTAHCKAAPAPCADVAATASGGIPPYTFEPESGLPFGLGLRTVDSRYAHEVLQPHLAGDQAQIGNIPSRMFPDEPLGGEYHYGICVIDAVGAEDCQPATVIVDYPEYAPLPTTTVPQPPTTEPTPTPNTVPPVNNLPAGFPTDLPDGTYEAQYCANGLVQSSCGDSGTFSVSNGDTSQMADGLQQLVDSLQQADAGSSCTVEYSRWNGNNFSIVDNCQGTTIFTLNITRVG